MSKAQPVIFLMFVLLLSLPIYADDEAESTETPSENDLENQELLPLITELLQPDADCRLPCLWGLVPGTSTVADVQDLWGTVFDTPIETTLGEDGRTFASFSTDFTPQNANRDISVTLTFKDSILSLLSVKTYDTSIWLE